MDIINSNPDILSHIIKQITIPQRVKYIPFGDGEQNYSIFYKESYPYYLVNKIWYNYFKSKLQVKYNE